MLRLDPEREAMSFPMTLLAYQKAHFALSEVVKAQHLSFRRAARQLQTKFTLSAVHVCVRTIKGLAEAVIKAVAGVGERRLCLSAVAAAFVVADCTVTLPGTQGDRNQGEGPSARTCPPRGAL